jgi:hypothetical protein
MGTSTDTKKCSKIFRIGGREMARIKATEAENGVENEKVENVTPKEEKTQETANTTATEDRFIYIGPSLDTGLKENAVFTGTRESVETYLKASIEKYPQARLLLVTTESLTKSKHKVRTAGTILNKYYNDIVSLSNKR